MPTDIDLFRWRLAETVAWCSSRAPVDDVANSLRSAALKPSLTETGTGPLLTTTQAREMRLRRLAESDSPAAHPVNGLIPKHSDTERQAQITRERLAIVEGVAQQRAHLLRAEDRYPERQAQDLTNGRLLICEPERSLFDCISSAESDGFFDEADLPPWDCWLCYVSEDEYVLPDGDRERLWTVVSWVPPSLLEKAQAGFAAHIMGALHWAEDVSSPLIRDLKTAGLL